MNRILALAVALLAAGFAVHGRGAQIEWDSVVYCGWSDDDAGFESGAIEVCSPYLLWASFCIEARTAGDEVNIYSYGGVEMEYWVTAIVSAPGDFVNEDTVPHLAVSTDDAFWEAWEADGKGIAGFGINVPAGLSSVFYLSFAGQNYNASEICYGWVELEFHEWEFNVLHSAVTYGGEPLIVGLIPEPSSAALLLLGFMVLGVAVKYADAPVAKRQLADEIL